MQYQLSLTMPDIDNLNNAEDLYSEGKGYDWEQDSSPAAAMLARANFELAAGMGHAKAARALAHLIYEGRGGPQDKEEALLRLWSAFKRGDHDALEELGDLLASYSEQSHELQEKTHAARIAEAIEQLNLGLGQVSDFMHELARRHTQ